MRRLGFVWLAAACAAIVLAPSAQAHELTKKKARAALTPVVAETAAKLAPAIAAKLPGATIAKSGVGPCAVTKKRHRAECVLAFSIQGGSAGEAECAVDARVQFRSKTSKELKVSIGSEFLCVFPVKLA